MVHHLNVLQEFWPLIFPSTESIWASAWETEIIWNIVLYSLRYFNLNFDSPLYYAPESHDFLLNYAARAKSECWIIQLGVMTPPCFCSRESSFNGISQHLLSAFAKGNRISPLQHAVGSWISQLHYAEGFKSRCCTMQRESCLTMAQCS